MSTSVTVTEPLKDHLIEIKEKHNLDNLDDTIVHVLLNDASIHRHVPDANTRDNPGVIRISDDTLQILKEQKRNSTETTHDDLLRKRSGASQREKGEEPIEWEPLDA